jgi:hypothetical protein
MVLVTPAFATPQAAKPADAFVDSIGVNTHFGNATYPENAYANRRIGAKLAELGVRHIRDHTWNDAGLKLIDGLHRTHRIRATLVLGETTRSPAELVKLLKAHPAYEAIEGLNEPDFAKRTYKTFADDRATNDYAATRAFQEELYAAVKADPKTKDVSVLSPAMGRSARSQFLLPIGFDVAAMHRYAWEGKTAMEPSFGVDEAIENMAKLRGDRPLWATESGYYNEPAAHARAAPDDVAGKYTPRLVAEFFNRGVARTYLYELADQGPDKSAREQNFGLLRHDMTEKPAYASVKHLIALLKEAKAREFTPGTLDFALDGAGDLGRVHHTLLQKSDGTFYLLLWQEVLSYDGATKAKIDNPPVNLTLSLVESFNVKVYPVSDAAKPTEAQRAVKSVAVSVPDEVVVVELSAAK